MTDASATRTVTPSQARQRILRCFKQKRPVFLWGGPGLGKSEVVEDLTKELNGHLIDLRLGQMEPTDIRGIPFFNKEKSVMDWAPPIELPSAELAAQYPIVVLFLDELNTAAPAVQAAAYQLILNRRVGQYKLPDNVVVVAAGNRESDKGVTYRMPTPLANRFVHLEVRVDFDSWFNWAVNKQIHQDVVGFISFSKGDLCNFDAKSASRAFATPRTWTFVSDFLQDESISRDELMDLVSGTVGEGTAIKFMGYRDVAADLPNTTDVLEGKITKLNTENISAHYSLIISMCYELKERQAVLAKTDEKEWHRLVDNFFGFMMANFGVELTVMGARVALTNYGLQFRPDALKNFTEFNNKYGRYVLASAR